MEKELKADAYRDLSDAQPLLSLAARVDAAHTAVLVIDMQNDFCAPGGYVERVIGKDIAACCAIVPRLQSLIDAARGHGVPVFWLRACYRPDLLPASMRTKLAEQGITEVCCDRDTWGYDWYGVQPLSGEPVLEKNSYDGFVGTTLEHELRARGIRTLVFAGVQTNICVEATLRHANALGFHCVVPEDCVASHTQPAHDATLNNVRFLLGDVTRLDALTPHWQASPRRVYLDYTQEELDRAYDQRAWADNRDAMLAWYAQASASARDEYPHHRHVPYGPGPHETLDIFPAQRQGAPIHVHVHGGGWRNLSKDDESFLARTLVPAGGVLVVLDFSLIPEVRLPDMIAQTRRALAWVHAKASRFGGDPGRIHLSGHSSGAHMAAVLATTDWESLHLPADLIKSALLISGMYDLHPVMLSARSGYVELQPDEIERYSPIRHLSHLRCPAVVAIGDRESPEFQRQARDFVRAAQEQDRQVELMLLPATNHYEIVTRLNDPGSALSQAALRLMDLPD